MYKPFLKIITAPGRSFLRLYETTLNRKPATPTLLWLALGMALGWWLYVPIHELLHAGGCYLGGGTVSELEIKTIYGGGFLKTIFPFVTSGGAYAGRLTGFDTKGSDLCYLLTVFLPFILTLPALMLMEKSCRLKSAFFFGFLLPAFMAPVISLSGDFLELGGIFLYQIWPDATPTTRLLISDDLFRLFGEISRNQNGLQATSGNYIFVFFSLLIGTFLAWFTLYLAETWRAAIYPQS